MPDFAFKLVSLTGVVYNYVSPSEISQIDQNTLTNRIPIGVTPGAEGEYQGNPVPDTRIIAYSGMICATSPQNLRDAWDAFMAGHNTGTPVKFYRKQGDFTDSERFLYGNISEITEGRDDGLNYKEWQVKLRTRPYYYSANQYGINLSIGGTASFPVGGNRNANPLIQLNFTHGGTATVRSLDTGQVFNLTARQAGLYTVDVDKMLFGIAGSVLSGSVDALTDFYGQGTQLPTGTANVSVVLSGAGAVSWGSALWNRRFGS